MYGIAADNPSAPTNLATESALTRTTASAAWTIAAQTVDVQFSSPDLASVIQEIVNRAGWSYGNAMILTVDNVGTDSTRLASIYTRDTTAGTKAPFLSVTWTHPTKSLVQIPVAASGDDVACPTTANSFNTSSPTITVGRSTVSSKTFFRFQNVALPNGATIEHARLVLRLSAAIGTAPALAVKGAAADNVSAPANQAAADAITRTSASVAFTPATGGAAGSLLVSADFASVVSEIVSRPGWASGNSLGVFVECTDAAGSPSGSVYTYDGQVAAALGNCSPLLEVRYTIASTGRAGRMMLVGMA